MRLASDTDEALRLLMFLAIHEDRPLRVSDAARGYGLSRNNLLKVTLTLSRLGYVKTVRGRRGGIALGRPSQDINVGEVVRAMEAEFALVECLRRDGGACVISPACRFKSVIRKAIESFLSVLDGYTLADITENQDTLFGLLGSPHRPAQAGTGYLQEA